MAPTRATKPKKVAWTPVATAALELVGVVAVSEEVGLRSLPLEPLLPEAPEVDWEAAGTVMVPPVLPEEAEEPEVELTLTLEEPEGVTKENWSDWARIELRFWASATRLTWKPEPEGQPEEGGLTEALPSEVTTRASRTCE